jgi:hypothetical protein
MSEEKLMNFGEALEYLKSGFGNKVARKLWEDLPMVLMLQKGIAKFKNPFLFSRYGLDCPDKNRDYAPWNPQNDDLLADDWFIVD